MGSEGVTAVYRQSVFNRACYSTLKGQTSRASLSRGIYIILKFAKFIKKLRKVYIFWCHMVSA